MVRRVSCEADRSGRYGVGCGGVVAMAARGPFADEANGDQGEVASCGSSDRGGDDREQPGYRGEPEPPSEQGAGGYGQEPE